MMKKNLFFLISLLFLIVLLFLMNLMYGSILIPFQKVWNAITNSGNPDEVYRIIILKLRLPSAIAAATAGAALSVAGLSMQTLFRNPLADPSILGISSGASLGVALVTLIAGNGFIAFFGGNMAILLSAFAGAMMVLAIIVALSQRVSTTTLLLVGVMLSFSISAITGILQFFASKEGLHSFVIWGMGSFKNITISQSLLTIAIATCLIICMYFQNKGLNVFVLGEAYAANSGIKIRRLSSIVVLLSGSLVAVVTAFCGPIAFIGLMVPHFARMLFKTFNHRILIPASTFVGICIMLICNILSSFPGTESVLPVNAITSVIGAPVVIFLLLKNKS